MNKEIPDEKKCKFKVRIGDDYGDNVATCFCELEMNHEGLHKEVTGYKDEILIIQWNDKRGEA